MRNLEQAPTISPLHSFPAKINDPSILTASKCHGFLHDAVLVVSSALFVVFLAYHAKKNLAKLYNRKSFIMNAYYALLWIASVLNLVWCCLQAWQCSPSKTISWNFLSLVTKSAMLCLEISLVDFFLGENYASALESIARTFFVSGVIVTVDALLKAIYVFGFGIPLFIDSKDTKQKVKWGLLTFSSMLLLAVYGYILFIRFSKWREKLPPRPAFYNYIFAMFVFNAVTLFSCGLVGSGSGIGLWMYSFTIICYHSLYLPFLFVTFLADFFQEEDFLLDNAYYSEMRDAGFFDADWD